MKLKVDPPKQYQQGWTEFYKLKFKVNENVLIPRPETELLIDEVLSFLTSQRIAESLNRRPTIVDVGTGSGCIAISLAKNLPQAQIFAIDKSAKALEVATKNAKLNHVEKRVVFLERDLLTDIRTAADVIVANLPYIPTYRLMRLDPLVIEFEPRSALDGGHDGLDYYRQLLNQIKNQHLEPKLMLFEIDEDQADLIRHEIKRVFPEVNVEIKKDLAKKDRIAKISF